MYKRHLTILGFVLLFSQIISIPHSWKAVVAIVVAIIITILSFIKEKRQDYGKGGNDKGVSGEDSGGENIFLDNRK